MVEYYNLTKYSEADGVIGFIKVTSELSNYWFGYSLILILFLVIVITTYLKTREVNSAFNIGSLFTGLLGIYFYVTGIVISSLVIYIPTLIFVITVINKYYTK